MKIAQIFNSKIGRCMVWALICLGAITVSAPLFAASPASDADNPFATPEEKAASASSRTWSDQSGKFKIEAKLVRVEDGKVVLRRTDDKEITVPQDKLCDADQKFIASVVGTKPASKSSSAAASNTDESKSDNDSSAVKKSEAVSTDYRLATVIDLTGDIDWKYAPDVATTTEHLPAVRIPLRQVDFFDGVKKLMLVPKEKKAFVVFYNDFKSKMSQVQACNLQTSTVEANVPFASEESPIDISPDGSLILSKSEKFGHGNQVELCLYSRDGSKVKPLKVWKPFSIPAANANDNSDADVKWAEFTDANHVLTVSTFGKVVLWQVPELKPIWSATCEFGTLPAFSANRKQVALISKREMPMDFSGGRPAALDAIRKSLAGPVAVVAILNVADGAVQGTMPLDEPPGFCAAALSEDGSRLALWQSGRIRVWDLQTRDLLRDFALVQETNHAGGPDNLVWVSNNHLLLNGKLLVDAIRRVPIWVYNRSGQAVLRDGKVWSLEEGNGRESRMLVSAVVPDKKVVDSVAKLSPDDLLVLHPGMEVALDFQISGDSDDVAAARTAITERLQKSGMKIASESKVRLIASTEAGKAVTVRYRSWNAPFGSSQEHQVSTEIVKMQLQIDGETIWKYESSTSPPGMLQLKEGESIDQALARSMAEQGNSLPKRCMNVWIPSYIALLPGTKADAQNPQPDQRGRTKATPVRDT